MSFYLLNKNRNCFDSNYHFSTRTAT